MRDVIDLEVRPDFGDVTSALSARFTAAELRRLDADFADASASERIGWAVRNFSPHLALTASMTDAVLIDLAVKVDPAIEVVFIDTGYHFPETLETVKVVRRRYGLNLRMMTVSPHSEELWRVDPENCCSAVKVGQLDRALQGKAAWLSGLRRDEASTRAHSPFVAHDLRGLIKLNPIADWDDEQVRAYVDENDIVVNPLVAQGYPSIGCQPCTRPASDDDRRSGRWQGSTKTECGLHL